MDFPNAKHFNHSDIILCSTCFDFFGVGLMLSGRRAIESVLRREWWSFEEGGAQNWAGLVRHHILESTNHMSAIFM